jgi:hypothetical protein
VKKYPRVAPDVLADGEHHALRRIPTDGDVRGPIDELGPRRRGDRGGDGARRTGWEPQQRRRRP